MPAAVASWLAFIMDERPAWDSEGGTGYGVGPFESVRRALGSGGQRHNRGHEQAALRSKALIELQLH